MSNFLDQILDPILDPLLGRGTAVNLTEIYANVEESKSILEKMKGEAATIRTQKASLQKLSAATENCWQGTSGNALREKLTALITEQEAIARDLERDTEMMLKTIQKLEDDDAVLARTFRQVGGGNSGRSSSGGGRRV